MQKSFIVYVKPSTISDFYSNQEELNAELANGWKVVSATNFFGTNNEYHYRYILLILEK